jgi:hypothetical protein
MNPNIPSENTPGGFDSPQVKEEAEDAAKDAELNARTREEVAKASKGLTLNPALVGGFDTPEDQIKVEEIAAEKHDLETHELTLEGITKPGIKFDTSKEKPTEKPEFDDTDYFRDKEEIDSSGYGKVEFPDEDSEETTDQD